MYPQGACTNHAQTCTYTYIPLLTLDLTAINAITRLVARLNIPRVGRGMLKSYYKKLFCILIKL
jgi:hypothetical protein